MVAKSSFFCDTTFCLNKLTTYEPPYMVTPNYLWSVGCQIVSVLTLLTGASAKFKQEHSMWKEIALNVLGASRSRLCPGSGLHLIRGRSLVWDVTVVDTFAESNYIDRQRNNWCWNRKMPEIQWPSWQLLLSTSCNRNHWRVRQVHSPLLELSCKETRWHFRRPQGTTVAPPVPVSGHGQREHRQHISLCGSLIWFQPPSVH